MSTQSYIEINNIKEIVEKIFSAFGKVGIIESDVGEYIVRYQNEKDAKVASLFVPNIRIDKKYPDTLYYFPTELYKYQDSYEAQERTF